MMRMTMVLALGFACAVSAWADDAPEVATAERIGLAYNQLGIGVTLKTPGATHVKVVLKDAQGAPVATKEAEVSGAAATVNFPDLTPGGIYQYDVFLKGDGDYVAPADWKPISVNLFSSVDWFDFAAGVFRQATPDANIEVHDQGYSSKNDALGTVTPTAASVDGTETVLDARFEVMGAYAWSDLPTLGSSQIAFGLALKENATGDTPANRVWVYKVGSGAWTALTTSDAPVADGTYDVRTVLDYRSGEKVASCTLTAGANTYTLFSDVPLTAERMNRFGIIGGNVVSQSADYRRITPAEVQPTGTQIELASSGEVDLAKLTADTSYTVTDHGYALCWKDTANRYATKSGNTLTLHTGVPANGLESFDSYALGLDPTVTLAKPAAVVKAGGMQSADGVTVHVPNVVKGNLPDAGVEVLFQRQKSTDKGQTWTDDGEPAKVGGELTIPFTPETLYRVNTVLK